MAAQMPGSRSSVNPGDQPNLEACGDICEIGRNVKWQGLSKFPSQGIDKMGRRNDGFMLLSWDHGWADIGQGISLSVL